MKRRRILSVLVSSAAILASDTAAFEIPTHEEISFAALELQTNLTRYLKVLGLESLDQKFGSSAMLGQEQTARDWVEYGSGREDLLLRVRNHFYDPISTKGLTGNALCPAASGQPSPDWALEEGVSQEFSFWDARRAFYDALTQPSQAQRQERLGDMFQALGHVMHLIQDAGQPQHVRNDIHAGLFPEDCYGTKSALEEHTNKKAEKGALQFAGYGPVQPAAGSTPREFWTTPDWKGIADYTNRGFVSFGTNFERRGCPDGYALPGLGEAWEYMPDGDVCAYAGVDNPVAADGTPLPCKMIMIRNRVDDAYTGGFDINPFASTWSTFNTDLERYNAEPTYSNPATGRTCTTRKLYTLTPLNYDAANQLLIPRAAAYSAGLLDYFFRGEIDMVPDPANPRGFVIKNLGDETISGTFELFYDDTSGERHRVQHPRWEGTVAANGGFAVEFSPPSYPAPTVPATYMLVFKGQMGEEGSPAGVGERYAVAAAVLCSVIFPTIDPSDEICFSEWRYEYIVHGGTQVADGSLAYARTQNSIALTLNKIVVSEEQEHYYGSANYQVTNIFDAESGSAGLYLGPPCQAQACGSGFKLIFDYEVSASAVCSRDDRTYSLKPNQPAECPQTDYFQVAPGQVSWSGWIDVWDLNWDDQDGDAVNEWWDGVDFDPDGVCADAIQDAETQCFAGTQSAYYDSGSGMLEVPAGMVPDRNGVGIWVTFDLIGVAPGVGAYNTRCRSMNSPCAGSSCVTCCYSASGGTTFELQGKMEVSNLRWERTN